MSPTQITHARTNRKGSPLKKDLLVKSLNTGRYREQDLEGKKKSDPPKKEVFEWILVSKRKNLITPRPAWGGADPHTELKRDRPGKKNTGNYIARNCVASLTRTALESRKGTKSFKNTLDWSAEEIGEEGRAGGVISASPTR